MLLGFAALPAFGTVDMVQLPAVQVQHTDGDLNLELHVTNYDSVDDGSAVVHTFTMKDKLQPVTVRLFYKAYKAVDVIETWTEITNGEKKTITLKRFDSGHLTLAAGQPLCCYGNGINSPHEGLEDVGTVARPEVQQSAAQRGTAPRVRSDKNSKW